MAFRLVSGRLDLPDDLQDIPPIHAPTASALLPHSRGAPLWNHMPVTNSTATFKKTLSLRNKGLNSSNLWEGADDGYD